MSSFQVCWRQVFLSPFNASPSTESSPVTKNFVGKEGRKNAGLSIMFRIKAPAAEQKIFSRV